MVDEEVKEHVDNLATINDDEARDEGDLGYGCFFNPNLFINEEYYIQW